MLLERSFRFAFRHFSTLFLIVAATTLPLHVAYSYAQRGVIAVSEVHDEIALLPEQVEIRGVGPDRLRGARTAFALLTLAELALVPLFVRAAARVLEADAADEVPTVVGAYRGVAGRTGLTAAVRAQPAALMVALLVGLAAGILAERIGLLLTEPLPRANAFAGVAVARAVARAVGAPLFLATAAVAAREAAAER